MLFQSTGHVAVSIKFSRQVEFGRSASKEGVPNGESAVMLKLRKELEDLKVCGLMDYAVISLVKVLDHLLMNLVSVADVNCAHKTTPNHLYKMCMSVPPVFSFCEQTCLLHTYISRRYTIEVELLQEVYKEIYAVWPEILEDC